MQVREASTGREAEGLRAKRVSVPNSEELEKIQQQLLFVLYDGREARKEAAPSDEFISHLNGILDNSMIDALETLERHYLFNPPLGKLEAEDLDRLHQVRELLTMLRKYQSARLRAVVGNLIRNEN